MRKWTASQEIGGATGGKTVNCVTEVQKQIEREIAHVLFLDIVGYSKLLITEESDRVVLDNPMTG